MRSKIKKDPRLLMLITNNGDDDDDLKHVANDLKYAYFRTQFYSLELHLPECQYDRHDSQ